MRDDPLIPPRLVLLDAACDNKSRNMSSSTTNKPKTKSPLLSPLLFSVGYYYIPHLFVLHLAYKTDYIYIHTYLNNNSSSISLNFSSANTTTTSLKTKAKRNYIIIQPSLSGKQVTSQSQQTCYCQLLSDSVVCLFAQRVVIIILLNGSSLLFWEGWLWKIRETIVAVLHKVSGFSEVQYFIFSCLSS